MARILVIDLNSNPHYPDLSIAYLVTPLRAAGYPVEVCDLVSAIKNSSSQPPVDLTNIQKYLEKSKPALILVPSYATHYAVVKTLAHAAHLQHIPVILGGGCLSTCSHEDLPVWLNLTGVSALFVGQADWVIADLVETALRKQDLSVWPGVCQHDVDHMNAPPLQELERLPIPDLADFNWQVSKTLLIPVLTGRTSSSEDQQRLYSTRPVHTVLEELHIQANQYQRKDFIFLDSRLNTNLAMWHGLIDTIQHTVPGCRWIATIYLDGSNALGLDLGTLIAARAAGLKHLNISLEAAQQLKQGKLLNAAMERNRELVANAYQAGLSVRCLASNNDILHNLADFPNTNDFALRKLVETEQAKRTQTSAKVTAPTNATTSATQKSQAQHKAKATRTLPTSHQPTKSFWQRFRKQAILNKTNESNQLV